MTTLQPITVNRIQYIGAYSKSKHRSKLRINKNEVLSPLATYTSEPSSSIKVKKSYHQKTLSSILPSKPKTSVFQRYTFSSLTTNPSNNEFNSYMSRNENYISIGRNQSMKNRRSIEVKIPGKKSESCDKDIRRFCYTERNTSRDISQHVSGSIDFYQIPIKLTDHSQAIDKNKYTDKFSIAMIIRIQSFLRRYLCRKDIYEKLCKFYTCLAFIEHIKKARTIHRKRISVTIFTAIKRYKSVKYFITLKEYEFLNYLKNRNIKSFDNFRAYISKLFQLVKEDKSK